MKKVIQMKIKTSELSKYDEKIIIPMYFQGDESAEYVDLDVDSMYDDLKHFIQNLEKEGE